MQKSKFEEILKDHGYTFTYSQIEKNGIMYDAVSISDGVERDVHVQPVMQLRNIEIMEEDELLPILQHAFDNIENVLNSDKVFYDKEYFMENCILCVRHKTDKEDLVKDYHPIYPDLEAYIRVKLGDSGSFVVKKEHILSMDIDENELFKAAYNNSRETLEVKTMREVFSEFFEDSLNEDLIPVHDEMYVVRCNNGLYGASAIFFDDVLRNIALKTGKDELTIIPSSIHECLVWTGRIDEEEANSMIQEVNETCVSEYDVLSDHAYTFTR